jgi:two-component system sensor histidine kinase MprB
MTLRTRFALTTGLIVLIVVAAVGLGVYGVTSSQLRQQNDNNLDSRIQQVANQLAREAMDSDLGFMDRRNPLMSDRDAITTLIYRDGSTQSFGPAQLPVTKADQKLLAGTAGIARDTVTVDSHSFRTLSRVLTSGDVLKIGINIQDTEAAQDSIRLWSLIIGLIGSALAVAGGWWFAGRTAEPIVLLTETAETITETQDLNHSIEVTGDAEVTRLAESFNTMLAALRTSVLRQRQLVQDASHELRTPLTSLRANTELLQRPGLTDDVRDSIFNDMRAEIDELAKLSGELSALASDQRSAEEVTTVNIAEIVEEVVEKAQRRTSGAVTAEISGLTIVQTRPQQLERAVSNLVDNAIKFSPEGSDITVKVDGTRISVHDNGPGISDEDKPFIFDRFYRAVATRSMPGSGLGLSIVSQFAEENGATTFVDDAFGGGAVVGIDLTPTE